DLAEGRGLATAEVGHAGADDHAPIHLEPDPRAGPVVEPDDAPIRLDVAGQASPDAVGWRGRTPARSERRPNLLRCLRYSDVGVDLLSDREPVPFSQGVARADRDRIHLQPPGDPLHL